MKSSSGFYCRDFFVCLFLCVLVSGRLLRDNFFFQAGQTIRTATSPSCKASSSFHHTSFHKQNFQAFGASWLFFTLLLSLPQFLAYFADRFFSTGIPVNKAAPLTKTLMRKNFFIQQFYFLKKSHFFYNYFHTASEVWQLKEAFSKFRTGSERDIVHHSVI